MLKEDEVKKRILEISTKRFCKFGFSRVSTDELANCLGISRKTLYKHYPTKNDLVRAVVTNIMDEVKEFVSENEPQFAAGDSLTDGLEQSVNRLGMLLAKIGVVLIEDLQKNAPLVWKEFDNFIKELITNKLRASLTAGVKSGKIRSDVNSDLLLIIILNIMRSIIEPEVLMNLPLSISEACNMVAKVITGGIVEPEYRSNLVNGGRKVE